MTDSIAGCPAKLICAKNLALIYPEIIAGVPEDWLELFEEMGLREVLARIPQDRCTPPPAAILNFARFTPLNSVRVIIIGQDPYPTQGHADGLAFSTQAKQCPASLRNIFVALVTSGLIPRQPRTSSLKRWAEQGVLLLNSALTTMIGKRNEHQIHWFPFTTRLTQRLSEAINPKPIFLLWGNDAKKHAAQIATEQCLTWVHPSPMNGAKFHSCPHFSTVNAKLSVPIDWNLDEPDTNDTVSTECSEPEAPKPTTAVTPAEYFAMHNEKTVIFTDGSCNPNKLCPEARGGFAAYWAAGPHGGTCLYGSISVVAHHASNQRAEGMAIYMAIAEYFKRDCSVESTELEIVTDSEFWVNMCVHYMPAWDRDGLNFAEKKNSDITVPLWRLMGEMKKAGHILKFRHMRAHDALSWSTFAKGTWQQFCFAMNNYVDGLAAHARQKMKPGTHVVSRIASNNEDAHSMTNV